MAAHGGVDGENAEGCAREKFARLGEPIQIDVVPTWWRQKAYGRSRTE